MRVECIEDVVDKYLGYNKLFTKGQEYEVPTGRSVAELFNEESEEHFKNFELMIAIDNEGKPYIISCVSKTRATGNFLKDIYLDRFFSRHFILK